MTGRYEALYQLTCDTCSETWAGGTNVDTTIQDAVTNGWTAVETVAATNHYCPDHRPQKPPVNDHARFVAARLDDDEDEAADQHTTDCKRFRGLAGCDCGVPERIRRWCHTGRGILAAYYEETNELKRNPSPYQVGRVRVIERVIRSMADADLDHPDHPHHQETA